MGLFSVVPIIGGLAILQQKATYLIQLPARQIILPQSWNLWIYCFYSMNKEIY